MIWFWRFILYSFLGFLLEVAYAHVTHSAKQDRKCLLLLPLCPVYGLGAVMILHLVELTAPSIPCVMAIGFLSASAAEYLMSLFYDRVLGVEFWDYSALPLNLDGRVCLVFSLVWTVLALVLVRVFSPWADVFLLRIPSAFDVPAVILFSSDLAVSSYALRRTGTTEVLRWYRP